jgi:hypothetical protein
VNSSDTLFSTFHDTLTEEIRDITQRSDETRTSAEDSNGINPAGFAAQSDVPRFISLSRLLFGLRKKYRFSNAALDRTAKAIELWESNNVKCSESNDLFRSNWNEKYPQWEPVLEEAKSLLEHWFSRGDLTWTLPLAECIQEARPGPGVNREVKSTDLYTKLYAGPLTFSHQGLMSLYASIVQQNPTCCDAETIRRNAYGKDDKVVCGKVTTVPKTNDIERVIMIEPSLNSLFQLGTEKYLRKVLWYGPGIDLKTQPEINRELARLGSLERGDQWGKQWATIDLSSASDTISVGLVERLLPRSVFKWLDFIACRTADLPDGRQVELQMMSSMGNGTTFPLQTLIFSALIAGYQRLQGKLKTRNDRLKYDFSVFGDDIIVPVEDFSAVNDILEACGFVVNRDKSFASGPFRESCGTDWHHGYDVRPVYVESLETKQEVVSLINRLNRWSAKHSFYFPKSIGVLIDSLRQQDLLVVPNFEGDDAGIHIPLGLIPELQRTRLGFLPNENPHVLRRMGGFPGGIVYKRYEPQRAEKRLWFCSGRDEQHNRIYELKDNANPSGVLASILAGTVRGTGITVRMHRVTYKRCLVFTPGWGDPSVFGGLTRHWSHSYGLWEYAVWRNLSHLLRISSSTNHS